MKLNYRKRCKCKQRQRKKCLIAFTDYPCDFTDKRSESTLHLFVIYTVKIQAYQVSPSRNTFRIPTKFAIKYVLGKQIIAFNFHLNLLIYIFEVLILPMGGFKYNKNLVITAFIE